MELKTDKAKVSYIIGEDIGNSFIREGYDLDIEVMIDALRKAANGEKQNLITEEEKKHSYGCLATRNAIKETSSNAKIRT